MEYDFFLFSDIFMHNTGRIKNSEADWLVFVRDDNDCYVITSL